MDLELLLRFERLEQVHWWFVARRALILETARCWAPATLERAADVGCGTGGNLTALADAFPAAEVLGVEPNNEARARARARGGRVISGTLEHLPLETGWADLVFALDVLEHVDDHVGALAELHRVVRPGGRLIVTVPALPWLWGPHDELNQHKRRYHRSGLRQLLVEAGWVVERLTYFNTFLFPLGAVERVVSRHVRSHTSVGLRVPPPPLNAALERVLALEAGVLRRRDLPIGMSLVAVATRGGPSSRRQKNCRSAFPALT
jgi:SAM-dependent methyltransferase